jgi:hypothetical protein
MGASCCLWTSDRYCYTRAISGVLLCQSSQWRAVVLYQSAQWRALVLYQGGLWCAAVFETVAAATGNVKVMQCVDSLSALLAFRNFSFYSFISVLHFRSSFLSVTISFLCLMQLYQSECWLQDLGWTFLGTKCGRSVELTETSVKPTLEPCLHTGWKLSCLYSFRFV